ncbi:PKD domain-containing protein [Streptacidiphilus sp. N1-10]|uniref:PKD domain-containing protein n=1 Tax=Streptacidiphilus jeojiensis TaxID=3229225 RepID=A0ABV6XMD9_9ACTN
MPRSRALMAVVAAALLIGGLGTDAASADATSLLVDAGKACSDSGSVPGTAVLPFCTIQAAVDAAEPGQTVLIEPDSYYSGGLTVTRSGEAGKPITITSAGPAEVVLLSSDPTGLTLTGVHDVDVSGIDLRQDGVLVQDSQRIGLDRLQMHGVYLQQKPSSQGAGVSIQGATTADVSVTRTTVGRSVAAAGIVIGAQVARTTISSDVITGGRGDGVAADSAADTVITGNTFTGNCFDAVEVTGAAVHTTVENNIMSGDNVARTGTADGGCLKDTTSARPELSVAATAAATAIADDNLVDPAPGIAAYSWSGTSYSGPTEFAATGQGTHDIQADPKLDAGDLSPAEGSPAVDSGAPDAVGLTATDAYGHQRVRDPLATSALPGSAVDRGAVERQDPLSLGAVTVDQAQGPSPFPVTASVAVTNPWHTAGVSYTFDFGDGTKVATGSPSASHTYTRATTYPSRPYQVSATATVPQAPAAVSSPSDGSALVTVNPPGPLTATLQYVRRPTTSGLAVALFSSSSSPWPITGYTFDFGDGTIPVTNSDPWSAAHTYPHPGTYTAIVTVTDKGGRTQKANALVSVGDGLVPFGPVRILDTRHGTGAPQHTIGAGGVLRLKVAGQSGLPASGVDAVTMNITATDATAATYITVYPDGSPRPVASTLNLGAGQTVPNQVTVKVGTDGYVDLANYNGTVDLIADVQGYYTTKALPQSGGFVNEWGPARLLDTRTGTGWPFSGAPVGKIGPGKALTFKPDCCPGTDSDKAVLLNLTETNATADSYVTAYAGGSARPKSSVLNFRAGQTTSNQVLVPIAADGTVSLYNNAGSVDLIADSYAVVDGVGAAFFPTDPTRVVDTRNGTGVPKAKIKARGSISSLVVGSHAIPQDTAMLLVNLTATNTTAATWLAVQIPGYNPGTSSLNLGAGDTRANSAEIRTNGAGSNHSTMITNSAGSTDAILDVEGYYLY